MREEGCFQKAETQLSVLMPFLAWRWLSENNPILSRSRDIRRLQDKGSRQFAFRNSGETLKSLFSGQLVLRSRVQNAVPFRKHVLDPFQKPVRNPVHLLLSFAS